MAEPTLHPPQELPPQLPAGSSSLQEVDVKSILNTVSQLDTVPATHAEAASIPQSKTNDAPKPASPRRVNHRQQLNKLYALPVPLRTYPLPTFVPHNPLSLFHILYTWLSQTVIRPSSHFDTLYHGQWSPETRSVHVTDLRSIRGLWEQGFYGKGTLSRSEPNWLEQEKRRTDSESKTTSEALTLQRRAERQQAKWERARKEREAISQRLSEEAEADQITEDSAPSLEDEVLHESDTSLTDEGESLGPKVIRIPPAPVTPSKLLALPNSALDLYEFENSSSDTELEEWRPMPVETLADEISEVVRKLLGQSPLESQDHVEDTEHLNGHTNGYSLIDSHTKANGNAVNNHSRSTEAYMIGFSEVSDDAINGSIHSDDTVQTSSFTPNGSALVNGSPGLAKIKRQKSVRFSPTVEKNTFIPSEPPSPDRANTPPITLPISMNRVEDKHEIMKNQEHFQLAMEEAFFLSYALGALTILDPITKSPIPNSKLFQLFRQHSSFPPLAAPSTSPDDPFMLNYIVYHHYRSLGWVVRGGSKFSCDLMLYNRGPVFNHAEFGLLILPSYNDAYWLRDEVSKKYVKGKEKRTWHWLHCINRVLTQAKKTLILVYVDVPAPIDGEQELALDKIFGRYKVREIILQRWSPNRQRD